jgi:hypothetical protein
MTERAQNSLIQSFLQRGMQDFTVGQAWAPTAPGPLGHARPQGSDWADSPTLKAALDLVDRVRPDEAVRGALNAHAGEPLAQAAAVVDASALPALERVKAELEAEGYPVALAHDTAEVELRVTNFNGAELVYRVHGEVDTEATVSLHEAYGGTLKRFPVIRICSWGRHRFRRPGACSEGAIQRDCRYEMRKSLLW